ncbi:MAG: 23S rRNA (guanosine(2251)-2'-O)-methyltransferase RlmB [Synergistaceae bacterium]|jgi:23S rRNA (guanosine2251-2'-O)-methyltransferase|nr:23S rRNA (guanosine(2251)-2'-O)-methyltransferase RlmB [Synergistaceae bacterium]
MTNSQWKKAPRNIEKAHRAGETDERDKNICWGRSPVLSLLEDDPSRCMKVTLSKTMQGSVKEKISALCRASGIPFSTAEQRAIESMARGENHQGVVAVVAASRMLGIMEAMRLLPKQPSPALAVLLDHVQDPRNLGAIIRSAEAAGAIFAAIPLRRSSLPTGTVVKTSAGASLRFPLATVGNVASTAKEIKDAGLWVIGLDTEAKRSIYSEPLPARTLLVVGGEDRGLGRTTANACDETLRIPISGGAGSLNASVALSVAMFEWSRVNRAGWSTQSGYIKM